MTYALEHVGQTYRMTRWALTVKGAVLSDLPFNPPLLSEWARSVESDKTPSFIIAGVLPTDNLVLLSGLPKESHKTWFAMLTALVASSGISTPALKCEVRTPVLYIYQEGARLATLNRFRALCSGHEFGDLESMEGIWFHHRSNFLLEKVEDVENVCEFVQQHGIGVVYIDTLAKSISGDENSAKEIGFIIRATSKIREAGATVVLVHHLRKGSPTLTAGTSGYPDPDKDLRGSGALAGAYETHWAIRAYPQKNPRDRKQSLLVGGKEAEWRHFDYAWQIVQAEDKVRNIKRPVSARCAMVCTGEPPFFEATREAKAARGPAVYGDDLGL